MDIENDVPLADQSSGITAADPPARVPTPIPVLPVPLAGPGLSAVAAASEERALRLFVLILLIFLQIEEENVENGAPTIVTDVFALIILGVVLTVNTQ